jgi:hypothetical protein
MDEIILNMSFAILAICWLQVGYFGGLLVGYFGDALSIAGISLTSEPDPKGVWPVDPGYDSPS